MQIHMFIVQNLENADKSKKRSKNESRIPTVINYSFKNLYYYLG